MRSDDSERSRLDTRIPAVEYNGTPKSWFHVFIVRDDIM